MLFVSPRFLFPADSGGKIRTSQILKNMKGGEFEITLLSPGTKTEEQKYASELGMVADKLICWEDDKGKLKSSLMRLLSFFSIMPVSVAGDKSKNGTQLLLRELAKKPDVVVFDFPHSKVLMPNKLTTPSVMFTHNVEAEIFKRHYEVSSNFIKRYVWKNQLDKMEKFEDDALKSFDSVIAVSQRDADYFKDRLGLSNIFTIKTGVDLEYFGYNEPTDEKRVVFTGSMDWLANIDGIEYFLDEIWPGVHKVNKDIKMVVIGKNPPDKLIKKAKAKNYNWEFTGFVDDVRDHVKSAAVYVIPLRVGGGTRIKAFEAMAMGCPIVSTSIGIEGLPITDKKHYYNADTAQDFSAAILHLAGNKEERNSISKEARSCVEKNFSNKIVAEEFESICRQTIDALN